MVIVTIEENATPVAVIAVRRDQSHGARHDQAKLPGLALSFATWHLTNAQRCRTYPKPKTGGRVGDGIWEVGVEVKVTSRAQSEPRVLAAAPDLLPTT